MQGQACASFVPPETAILWFALGIAVRAAPFPLGRALPVPLVALVGVDAFDPGFAGMAAKFHWLAVRHHLVTFLTTGGRGIQATASSP